MGRGDYAYDDAGDISDEGLLCVGEHSCNNDDKDENMEVLKLVAVIFAKVVVLLVVGDTNLKP